MTRRGGRVFQRRYELDASGAEVNSFELEATYAIGSGNHARTYLSRSESGELIELPVGEPGGVERVKPLCAGACQPAPLNGVILVVDLD